MKRWLCRVELLQIWALAATGSSAALATRAVPPEGTPPAVASSAPVATRESDDDPELPGVMVKARARSVPIAEASVERAALETAALGVDLPEVLVQLPGVVALERQNQVQDSPLVVRGFGARSGFGTRGVRIEADGVPYSFADGQGQLAGLQPWTTERVSLISGPYATIAGFNAGALLRVQSRTLQGTQARAAWQAEGGYSAALGWGDTLDVGALGFTALHARQQGARPYSASERSTLGSVWRRPLGDGELQLRWDLFDQPYAEDPGSVDATGLDNPAAAADPVAVQLGAGKSVRQHLLSVGWQADAEDRVTAYLGRREVLQVLPLAPAQQVDRPGVAGWTDLQRTFFGLRGARSAALGGWNGRAVLELEVQDDTRLGYENFRGTQLGERGRLKRDEQARFETLGAGLELTREAAAGWHTDAGLRWNLQRSLLDNAFVAPSAPSGTQHLSGWTGYLGLRWQPASDQRWRLAWGRGLETPTATERANRADGAAGFNDALQTARSNQWELHHERRIGSAHWRATAYHIDTDDDLVVVENLAGRVVFGNAASTRRSGFEWDWHQLLSEFWSWRLSGQWGRAEYGRDVPQCTPACPPGIPPRLRAGARLPATPRLQARGELVWRQQAHQFGVAWLHRGALVVDDRRQIEAPALQRLDLRYSRRLGAPRGAGGGQWHLQIQVEDVLDRGGVAGIAINEGSGRYFDPAPGRQLAVVLQWRAGEEAWD